MLLLSAVAAQTASGAPILQSVTAVQEGADLRVEITVSSPVTASAETASHPDRILLDLPGTICPDKTKQLDLRAGGIRHVRSAQHSTTPIVTRVVIDLDQAHPYVLESDGSRIILIISPALVARASHQGAQAAAKAGAITAIFRRGQKTWVPSPSQLPDSAEPTPPLNTAATNTSQAASSVVTIPSPRTATTATTGFPSATESSATTTKVVDSTAAKAPAEPVAAITPSSLETTLIARTDDPSLHTVFKVKYVAEGVAYLDGGKAQGLAEGMKLVVEDNNLPAKQGDSVNTADPRVVAELVVSAVADTSAVADIHVPRRPVKVGDLAYLSSGDAAALVQQRALSSTRQYPAVISFTEGDTLDEEAREEVPRPPLPSVNRARGRIGLDYEEIISHGTTSLTSSEVGMVFRGDITRIGGTYWNLSGYWRGRLTNTSAASQQTLQDLINHTYHLSMTYDNPNSTLVAGFGRLYLPWASSLDTIDGGYFGKRLSKGTTVGVFGGSTPDPTSWNYSPDRVIGGTFVNFEGGDFNTVHYSSTSGVGVSMLSWQLDRPFIFFEDSVSYGRRFAIYESAQLDDPVGNVRDSLPRPGARTKFFYCAGAAALANRA